MGHEFSTTEALIRATELGDAFLEAPLKFLRLHPEALLVHRSRDRQLTPQELRDLQQRTVSAQTSQSASASPSSLRPPPTVHSALNFDL